MEVWIIDEAEDFIVINCCGYTYYKEGRMPPWDLEFEEWPEIT